MIKVMNLYSFARKCYLLKIPLLPRITRRIMRFFYSCEIPYTANIHSTVNFAHRALGVVIGHDSIIGENTKILQNVTIGGRSGVRANPIIGKNVLIGVGACVLGKVTVGDNASIGANAVVISNVPEGCIAVGVPAVIKYGNDGERNDTSIGIE